jgi:cytidylate kinase
VSVVTVSRLPGAHGDALATALAERLGYRLVGRSELVKLAEHLVGFDIGWEGSPELRERSPSFWERLNEERARYLGVLRSVTMQLAEQDNVVVVGLGAGQLLGGLRHVLRLQVVAPEDMRLARLMAEGFEQTAAPLTHAHARNLLRRRERESAAYMRHLFHIDWLDPQHSDLVLNTDRFSVADAVEIVASVVHSGLLRPSAADTQYLDDLVLASRIESAVRGDGSRWVDGLRVAAHAGHVHVQGAVFGVEDRIAVEQLGCEIPGVRVFESELRVQPPVLSDV